MAISRAQIRSVVYSVYADLGLNLDTFDETTDLTTSGKILDILHHTCARLHLQLVPTPRGLMALHGAPLVTLGDLLRYVEILASAQSWWMPRCLVQTAWIRFWWVSHAWWIGIAVRHRIWMIQPLPCVRITVGRASHGVETG